MLEHREYDKFYIIPSIITYSNLLLGVFSIIICNYRSFDTIKLACYLVIIAGLTDKLDGYVARRLNMTSEFGKQLDSLSDLVSFGIAPIVITISMSNSVPLTLSSFIYIGSGAFRLARFNILKESMYITGLPITLSGMIIGLKNIIDINYRIKMVLRSVLILENIVILLILSVLMLSTFRIKKPF